MKRIKCWHFLRNDRHLRWGTQEVVEVGKTYSCEGEIGLCKNGMHGSERIIDALRYAPGPIVCRVEIWGDVIRDDDKLAGRHRKVLSMADCSRELHWFATRVAEHALKRAKVTDKRCWNAIEVKRKWIDGKATDVELAAAWNAAWNAARAAAWNAARAAVAYAAAYADESAAEDVAREIQSRYLKYLVMKKMQGVA